MIRVIVACERSGVVREAFNAYSGVEAISCDLEGPEDGRVDFHYQGDILRLLYKMRNPFHYDLLIAHPPCTHLCSSGLHWTTRGKRDPNMTRQAIEFAERLWEAPCRYICIENPVGCLSTRSCLGKFRQKIQPYEYGEDASKGTCLWLKNLPTLFPSKHILPRQVEWPVGSGKIVRRWSNQTDSGQNKLPPSPRRAMDRARTYPGIAAAMASQWIPYIIAMENS
jgi:site-specific DNA-cytosine methylase